MPNSKKKLPATITITPTQFSNLKKCRTALIKGTKLDEEAMQVWEQSESGLKEYFSGDTIQVGNQLESLTDQDLKAAFQHVVAKRKGALTQAILKENDRILELYTNSQLDFATRLDLFRKLLSYKQPHLLREMWDKSQSLQDWYYGKGVNFGTQDQVDFQYLTADQLSHDLKLFIRNRLSSCVAQMFAENETLKSFVKAEAHDHPELVDQAIAICRLATGEQRVSKNIGDLYKHITTQQKKNLKTFLNSLLPMERLHPLAAPKAKRSAAHKAKKIVAHHAHKQEDSPQKTITLKPKTFPSQSIKQNFSVQQRTQVKKPVQGKKLAQSPIAALVNPPTKHCANQCSFTPTEKIVPTYHYHSKAPFKGTTHPIHNLKDPLPKNFLHYRGGR